MDLFEFVYFTVILENVDDQAWIFKLTLLTSQDNVQVILPKYGLLFDIPQLEVLLNRQLQRNGSILFKVSLQSIQNWIVQNSLKFIIWFENCFICIVKSLWFFCRTLIFIEFLRWILRDLLSQVRTSEHKALFSFRFMLSDLKFYFGPQIVPGIRHIHFFIFFFIQLEVRHLACWWHFGLVLFVIRNFAYVQYFDVIFFEVKAGDDGRPVAVLELDVARVELVVFWQVVELKRRTSRLLCCEGIVSIYIVIFHWLDGLW